MNFTITVLWIVYPSHPLRAFPVMFCTVNEEFAMSWDGSWRCIHAWEQRVPVIWPLVRLKTRQTRKFCPIDAGVMRLPWELGPEENFAGGTARPLAHTSCCRNMRIEPLKAWLRPLSGKFARQRVRYYRRGASGIAR